MEKENNIVPSSNQTSSKCYSSSHISCKKLANCLFLFTNSLKCDLCERSTENILNVMCGIYAKSCLRKNSKITCGNILVKKEKENCFNVPA